MTVKLRLVRAIALAAVAVAALGVAPATALETATSTAATPQCSLYAEQPEYNGSINGWGHWSNCPSSAKVTVVLRQDRKWWPDKTLTSASGTGSHGSRLLVYGCGNHFDPIKVFVETRYGDKKVQSPRSVLPCA